MPRRFNYYSILIKWGFIVKRKLYLFIFTVCIFAPGIGNCAEYQGINLDVDIELLAIAAKR